MTSNVADRDQLSVHVAGLSRRYGEFLAVDDLDLDVRTGEVFSLLGPNGAGKTTTLEILEGFRRRDAGEVSVLGVDPAKADRKWRDRVGIVSQSTGAFDELTMREIVAHHASFYSQPLGVDEVIDLVGLSSKAKARGMQLSGGQKRRLDVALGIVGDPDLVFLDEPSTGLDPEARHQAWDLVRLLTDRGKTIILTTHYLEEAEALAHRVGVIVAGQLLEIGTPQSIGGRANTVANISFTVPASLRSDPLPVLPPDATLTQEVGEDGLTIRIASTQPTAAMRAVLGWAQARGLGEIHDLVLARPSLEDVYLRMIADSQNLRPTSGSASDRGGRDSPRGGASPAPQHGSAGRRSRRKS